MIENPDYVSESDQIRHLQEEVARLNAEVDTLRGDNANLRELLLSAGAESVVWRERLKEAHQAIYQALQAMLQLEKPGALHDLAAVSDRHAKRTQEG